MALDAPSTARYLARIGYRRAPSTDLRTLFGLQRAHLLSVPFENLDIRRGRRLELEPEALFDKIVVRRRGGFCHELNGLYADLLRTIGFQVTRIAARVHTPQGGLGAAYAHMALRVRCGSGSYLVDVGFGDSSIRPLRLERRRTRRQGLVGYAVAVAAEADGQFVLMRDRLDGAPPEPCFRFGLEPHDPREFEPMCLHQQTSPESHFTRSTICSRATPTGRLSLSGDRLIETRGADRIETLLRTPEAIDHALTRHFGIVL